MIEEKLLEKGVSNEELEKFARLPLHNPKKDVFRIICDQTNWEDIKRHEKFIKSLAEVLADIVEEMHPEFQLSKNNGQRRYLGEERYRLLIAQKMAVEMLGTLIKNREYGQHDFSVTLDRIYEDTFKQEASK